MKISCTKLETPVILEEAHPFVLCIENPHEYYRIVNQFLLAFRGSPSDFSFWEDGNAVRADKVGEILTDPFSFEFGDKKIITLLYKQLQQNFLYGTLLLRFQEVSAEVERFLAELCDTEDFALEYNEIALETLLKGCSVRPSANYESLLEKLVCYLNLCQHLKGIRFFVFVGLKSVLNDEELILLYRHCTLHKISLLLIESAKVRPLLAEERAIIITEDLCELVENFSDL